MIADIAGFATSLHLGFWGFLTVYLEVRFTYNLLNNCSYNPIIFRVTVVMGFIIRLYLQLLIRL